MLNLIKKEFALCLHPTSFIFLSFALLCFVPNYPYEVVFFFSGLSVFFYSMNARETGDLIFTAGLPVSKSDVPKAKILTVALFQVVLTVLVGLIGEIKCLIMPGDVINQAGISANLSLVGNGALILSLFNLTYFSMYFKNPDKIGISFLIASALVFVLIIVFIVLRHTTVLYGELLNGLNSENTLLKLGYMLICLCVYAVATICSIKISVNEFAKIDL